MGTANVIGCYSLWTISVLEQTESIGLNLSMFTGNKRRFIQSQHSSLILPLLEIIIISLLTSFWSTGTNMLRRLDFVICSSKYAAFLWCSVMSAWRRTDHVQTEVYKITPPLTHFCSCLFWKESLYFTLPYVLCSGSRYSDFWYFQVGHV